MRPTYWRIILSTSRFTCWSIATCLFTANAATENSAEPNATTAKAAGEWKWSITGRNGQPEETALKLEVAADGSITGTLTDRAGTRPLTNASLNGVNLRFTVLRDTPNGKVPIDYSLKLDERDPKITIEYPDSTPAGKRATKKRRLEAEAWRDNKPKS